MSGIIAAFSDDNIVPSLFEGLQRMQFEYGEHDGVSIAALMGGRIEKREFIKKEAVSLGEDFSRFLQKQSLNGGFTLVCLHQKQQSQKYTVDLAATEEIAIVYHGFINNLSAIQKELLRLGERFDSLRPCELILCFIRHYLNLDMSVREATRYSLKRLKGEFTIIALFANQKSLIVAQRGVPMTLCIQKNEVYIASNTAARIMQPTMLIEENSLLLLRSFQK